MQAVKLQMHSLRLSLKHLLETIFSLLDILGTSVKNQRIMDVRV